MIRISQCCIALAVATALVLPRDAVSAPFPALQWSAGPERIAVSNLAMPGSGTEEPGRPAVAFDGTNHLIVTYRLILEQRTNMIVGALVSPNDQVMRVFDVAAITPHYQGSRPAVAFAGTNFLVVFVNNSAGGVYAKRISRDGSVLDPGDGLLIASSGSASHGWPAVASDGERFLVVWTKGYWGFPPVDEVRGAFISGDGTVSPEFPIATSRLLQNKAIAFGGGMFFVVWEDGRWASLPNNFTDIAGTRVSMSGNVLDAEPLQLGRAPYDQLEPHVAFAGTNFFIVWEDERTSDYFHPDIYGTRVSVDGVVLDNPEIPSGRLLVASEHQSGVRWPRVTSDGSQILLFWTVNGYTSNSGGELAGIYLARFAPNGDLLDGTNALSAGLLLSRPEPDCDACRVVHPEGNFDGRSYFLSYAMNTEMGGGDLKDVRYRRVSRVLPSTSVRGTLPAPTLRPDGCREFAIDAAAGQTLVLEASTNLLQWQKVDSQHSVGLRVGLRDCTAAQFGSRFYRVRQQ